MPGICPDISVCNFRKARFFIYFSFPPATNFIKPALCRSRVLGESGQGRSKILLPSSLKSNTSLTSFHLFKGPNNVCCASLECVGSGNTIGKRFLCKNSKETFPTSISPIICCIQCSIIKTISTTFHFVNPAVIIFTFA